MPDDFPVPLGHQLRARVEHADGVATLVLAGEFDLAGAAPTSALLEEIEIATPGAIVVDVRALTFLASAGAMVLVEAHNRSLGTHRFAILKGSGPAHRALTLMGIDQLLTMVSSVDDLSDIPTETAKGD